MYRENPFPPIETADENGLLAIGGKLSTPLLLTAYMNGIFPWPVSEDQPIAWFSPDPRGIIETTNIHIPKSFKRFLNQHQYQVTFNTRFDEVIIECAKAKRPGQFGTWITPEMIESYKMMFRDGYAYSVEVIQENELVGGLYGVCIGEFFSGESMFYKKPQASKLALYSILKKLQNHGVHLLDTQMITPVTEMFGAKNLPREDFVNRLSKIDFKRSAFL